MIRSLPFRLALLVLALAWLVLTPFTDALGFLGHMTVHVMVVALAAPLLAIALAGSRHDPTPRAPLLFGPMSASIVEFVVVWGWHAPALHFAARTSLPFLAAEQLSFLGASLLVWLAAFGRQAQATPAGTGAGILALFVTSMHMTLLGALLTLAPRLLFDPAVCGTGTLSPLEDQNLGGVLMLLGGGASYLVGGLVLTARLLRTSESTTGR